MAKISYDKEAVDDKEADVKIDPKKMKHIGSVDERFQSYNIEMAEVVGGNFWKPYHQMKKKDSTSTETDESLHSAIPAIDLYQRRLRILAASLGPVYLRVSGTWANSVYFQDNSQPPLKEPPKGFNNVLTRKQWKAVIDFADAVDAKIVTSFAISNGVRNKSGIWTPVEAKKIIEYTKSVGGEISAAEFFNEPNIAMLGGAPIGYKFSTYMKDINEFTKFCKSNLPDMLVVGPGSVGEGVFELPVDFTTEQILSEAKPEFDVFSYHFYGAISQRFTGKDSITELTLNNALKAVLLNLVGINLNEIATTSEEALSEDWLSRTVVAYDFFSGLCDKYEQHSPIWITETADALWGGNPWSATFLDCFRYLEQLGRLAKCGVQVIMHNTLTASEYSLLDQSTHLPKPNYWAALLWARLMGKEVYESRKGADGVDLFAHDLKGHQEGITVLVINTNKTEVSIDISSQAEQYTLTSEKLNGKTVELNGQKLRLGTNDAVPTPNGREIMAGNVKLPPTSITFLTFADTTPTQ